MSDREIERLLMEFAQLQTEYNRLLSAPGSGQISDLSNKDDGQVNNRISREKCKQMQAELTVLDSTELKVLPEEDSFKFEILCDDMSKRIQQTNECLKFVQSQQKETDEELDREKKTNEELESAVQIAERRLSESANNKDSTTEIHSQLKDKCKILDKDNKQKMRQMTAFLEQHFPLPDVEAFNKVKRKIETTEGDRLTSLKDLKPLKSILETIVNKSLETPNEPYVTLDKSYWPPYVGLLLQCDLALRHPLDSRRIKLMPFHL